MFNEHTVLRRIANVRVLSSKDNNFCKIYMGYGNSNRA